MYVLRFYKDRKESKMSPSNVGRNRSEIIYKENGRVFKKYMIGNSEDTIRRYNNLILWNRLSRGCVSIKTPAIVAVDPKNKCVEYEYIGSTAEIPAYNRDSNQIENLELLRTAFDVLVKVHSISVNDDIHISPLDSWRGISIVKHVSLDTFVMASGAELELIRFLQNEEYIKNGCIELYRERERAKGRRVVSHGDFRPDQVINTDNGACIIDFEELCLAHAEFDIASYCASIAFLAIRDTLSKTSDNYTEEEVDDFIVNNVSMTIDTCFTEFRNVVDFYESRVGYKLSNILLNLEFAWAILERIFSHSKFSFSLGSLDRAITGIVRQIFINPDQSLLKEVV